MIDYSLIPGREKKDYGELKGKNKTVISIITPFYNGGKTLEQTAKSLFNQTYPYFEWIIVDDGSKDEESLKKLDKVAKMDDRIKVFHKENGGPSMARDFGIEKASKESKYVFFIDCDDLMENTMLECLYWTLETHPEASFAYTAMTNFEGAEFIWERYLTTKIEKKANVISIASMIRKEDLLEVGCFGIKEKSMYEDWNLWLKLLAKGKKPIRINAPLFWYRFSNTGELSRAKKNNKNAMKYVNESAKKVKREVEVIQFPREGEKYITPGSFDVDYYKNNMVLPEYEKNGKKTILFIFPWMVVGGADLFNLELIKRMDSKKYEAIVVTTFPTDNTLRQEYVESCREVYDMSSFLDRKDYLQFVDYLISTRKVDIVFNSNSTYGYSMLPYIKSQYNIPVIDYIHSIDLKDPRGGFGRYSIDFDECIDATYACNGFTTNQLKEMFGKENVETLYIGTDSKKFDPSKFNSDELKEKYNIPKDKKVITFIARLSEEKRPKLFVKFAAALLKERNDLFFVIAGDGPKRKSVEKEISKQNISENVAMLGMIKETEEVYSISDITVNCSRLEGLALTAYESLSMGVPVVSSDVGGQKELITDEVGRIIPYKEKMTKYDKEHEIELYKNAILEVLDNLDELKKNSRKRIMSGFTLNHMVEKFEEIFDTLKPNGVKVPKNLALSAYKSNIEYLYDEYEWFTSNYIMDHYPELLSNMSSQIFKDRMWQHPMWRLLVKTPLWKVAKKIVKKRR